MDSTQEEQIIKQARQYIMESVPLGKMGDEELEERK